MPHADMANVQPDPASFAHRFRTGEAQLVWVKEPADLDTPVGAMLRLKDDQSPCFLLESVEKGEIRGRYSIIGIIPDLLFRAHGNHAEIGDPSGNIWTASKTGTLDTFRALYEQSAVEIPPELPPMASGLVGYMGYDMVKLMERLPDSKPDSIGIPDSFFMRPQIMVIFDSVTDSKFIITVVRPEPHGDATHAYEEATQRIWHTLRRLSAPLPEPSAPSAPATRLEDFVSNTPREDYNAMIAHAQEHIRAGDIFQVVLSQRFSAPFALPPFALYRALRQLNPSPFLFYLHMGGFTLVGSSPEILVRLRGDEVTIRPIAGTRKRGRDRAEDEALARDLLADPKEISEHLMLLDLGRNDVGRVAKPGTVRTTQNMSIENYSHVMHIVSNVVGEIDPKYDALSALIAGFPAGTVSGAPKIRAMEIIDDLEKERRSFYAGCIGYFSGSGNMDTAITLRTGLIKDGTLYVQAGGGIVAESRAEDEYQESHNKAKALMRAAEEAIRFL